LAEARACNAARQSTLGKDKPRFQLVEEFREAAPDVPIIIISGVYKGEKYADELSHARAFMEKPLGLEELERIAEILRSQLDGRNAQPEQTRTSTRAPASCRRADEPWIPTSVVPLGKALQLLRSGRRSGILSHRAREHRTAFVLEGGDVRFVRCNDPALSLGQILLGRDLITQVELDAAQDSLEKRVVGTRLGQVLVEDGSLRVADVERSIQVQLRKIIARAFCEHEGATLFREATELSNEDIVLDVDTRAIIVAGCAAVKESGDELLAHLPDGCQVSVLRSP
jgi:hypothetical protein